MKKLFKNNLLFFYVITLITSLFINLISEPIGEEPGYRGYFLPELTKEKGSKTVYNNGNSTTTKVMIFSNWYQKKDTNWTFK